MTTTDPSHITPERLEAAELVYKVEQVHFLTLSVASDYRLKGAPTSRNLAYFYARTTTHLVSQVRRLAHQHPDQPRIQELAENAGRYAKAAAGAWLKCYL